VAGHDASSVASSAPGLAPGGSPWWPPWFRWSADLEDAAVQGGHVVIADTGNDRIRTGGRNGTIRTVAGNDTRGFAGDGGPALPASTCSRPARSM